MNYKLIRNYIKIFKNYFKKYEILTFDIGNPVIEFFIPDFDAGKLIYSRVKCFNKTMIFLRKRRIFIIKNIKRIICLFLFIMFFNYFFKMSL